MGNQILAEQAILSRVSKEVLNAHLHSCVLSSVDSGSGEERRQKMDEIAAVLDKLIK